ncbi:MAG: ROK family protein [Clostridia bacterium]|nr:ROK family protein [Clostridia bacterium]
MIGFDIGGTKCAVCVGCEKNGILQIEGKKVIPTDLSVSPYEMIDRMCTLAEELTDDFSVIGISCGGPLNSRTGVILSPPNLRGWDQVKIVEYLKNKYHGCVRLQNDANACALAEWKWGAGRGTENMVFLTFGTGMGAGIIAGGQMLDGACGFGGEVGHMRLDENGPVGFGKRGSFEGFCSGSGLAQIGRTLAMEKLQCGIKTAYCQSYDQLSEVTAKSIAEAAYAGDETAKEAYRLCGHYLGKGLALLIDILNPEAIVIGSIFARSEDLLRPAMEEVLSRECIPYSLEVCQILPAALDESIGDMAALAVAADAIKS